MKIAILSDIHANAPALDATLGAVARIGVDRIACAGDVVGYNTDADECVGLLQAAGVVCVAGNHDRAVCDLLPEEGFNGAARRAIAWTRRHAHPATLAFLRALPTVTVLDGQLVLVHGALHPESGHAVVRLDSDDERLATLRALVRHPSGARICAVGHTHRLGIHELHDGALQAHAGDEALLSSGTHCVVNPGSVGQPRGDDPRATFLVLDTRLRRITVHRVEYDRRPGLARTRRAGLAPRLGFLPRTTRDAVRRALRPFGIVG